MNLALLEPEWNITSFQYCRDATWLVQRLFLTYNSHLQDEVNHAVTRGLLASGTKVDFPSIPEEEIQYVTVDEQIH
jgi:hypothetical protein